MANTMKKVDAVVVGFGWAGSIMAKELTEAGLNVVVLERGPHRDTYPDGAYPQVIDELTYNTRRKLFQDLSKSTVTIRHNVSQTALPYRQLAAFCQVPEPVAQACTGLGCISVSTRWNCACAAIMKNAMAKISFLKG